MSLSDPIGDMIARIKNSQARKHKSVKLPSSKFKIKIAEVLKDEGFIIDFKTDSEGIKTYLDIILKYSYGNPVIKSKNSDQSLELLKSFNFPFNTKREQ